MRILEISIDHQRVAGRLLAPAEPGIDQGGVLFIHGWGGSQRQDLGIAKQLATLGSICLTFNMRGHARTRRQRDVVTRADSLRDVLAAYDALAAEPVVDVARMGVVGSSYGAYLATLLTMERDVSWLALRAPALYKDEDFERPKCELNLDGTLAAYRRCAITPTQNRALRAAAAFKGDVLVVESGEDTVIPHQVIANYVTAFGAAHSIAHEIIAGADHGLSQEAWRRAYGQLLRRWLATRAAAV
jgi:hypothetical protein